MWPFSNKIKKSTKKAEETITTRDGQTFTARFVMSSNHPSQPIVVYYHPWGTQVRDTGVITFEQQFEMMNKSREYFGWVELPEVDWDSLG